MIDHIICARILAAMDYNINENKTDPNQFIQFTENQSVTVQKN
jgi:hypothetical protein